MGYDARGNEDLCLTEASVCGADRVEYAKWLSAQTDKLYRLPTEASIGRKENLHSLWDTALVELEQGTLAEIPRIQPTANGEDRQQWQQGTPADWALNYWR